MQLPELKVTSQHASAMRSVFETWSDTIKENEQFANKLVEIVLNHAFTQEMLQAKSLTTQYEKMWAGYHRLITGDKLSSLWHSTFHLVETPKYFQQFMQLVTRRVMDEAAKSAFDSEDRQSTPEHIHFLKADEEQALRYVAGYVPMRLKRKYSKQPNNKRALKFLQCLSAMSHEEGDDIEFLRYTKLWVEQVNRGGLYQVSNDTYLVFRAMELASRRVLSIERVTAQPTLSIQEAMQKSIMHDPSVTAHWNYVLGQVESLDDSESDELFSEIVDLWVKIRGHSFASGWVEQYQLATKQSTRKKGLRKSLQTSDDCEEN